jgi:hypothetical protein
MREDKQSSAIIPDCCASRTLGKNQPFWQITVTLTIRGASGGQWSVRQEGGTWRLYAGAPERRHAEVLIDEAVAWRLFTRGLRPEYARAQVTLVGDQILASKVYEMVSIIA